LTAARLSWPRQAQKDLAAGYARGCFGGAVRADFFTTEVWTWRGLATYFFHEERNHQGLDNRLISGPPVIKMTSRVRRRPRLGGLLNFL
jgi:hypothetical protein